MFYFKLPVPEINDVTFLTESSLWVLLLIKSTHFDKGIVPHCSMETC